MNTAISGIVAAGHQVTAEAAADTLRRSGNAFDAALSAVLTSFLTEPVLSSIGGGGFLMAYDAARNETKLYDFFAQTPKSRKRSGNIDFYAIEADFGPVTQEFHIGAASAATPGLAQGLFSVHRDLCALSMADIAHPAIKAARYGVELTPFQASLHKIVAPILTASPEARAIYAPDGELLAPGTLFVNRPHAELLEQLCDEGETLFTRGAVGEAVLEQSDARGGFLQADDLEAYKVEKRVPLQLSFAGAELFTNPPPSAGGALAGFGLRLLDSWASDREIGPMALAEVMAETNRARESGAEVFSDDVIAQHVAALQIRPKAYRGTTHISVVDAAGNAAAVTVSNGEGNGLIVGDYGFMLNNMLGEEDLNPAGFHKWPEDARLSSMMSPTLIREADGALTALGSGGSNRIRTAILQVAVNLLSRGMTLPEAVAAPRMHLEKTGKLSYEAVSGLPGSFSDEECKALEQAFSDSHAWPVCNLFFGGVHAVRRRGDGSLEGAGDHRRQGVVVLA